MAGAGLSGTRVIRFTRRGRLVIGAGLLVLAFVVFSLGRFTAGASASAPTQRVTVAPGDSLWSIAQRLAPTADPRTVVSRLLAANHLADSAMLSPGDVLVVPAA